MLGFVRCNEISLYRGSFSYILLYLREGKLFLVPRTLLYRGFAILINNIGALSRCKPRIPASRLFLFFTYTLFSLTLFSFFFFLSYYYYYYFFFEMQLLVPILSEVFLTVINSICHFRTEIGTRVEMYPVIQIQFLDG